MSNTSIPVISHKIGKLVDSTVEPCDFTNFDGDVWIELTSDYNVFRQYKLATIVRNLSDVSNLAGAILDNLDKIDNIIRHQNSGELVSVDARLKGDCASQLHTMSERTDVDINTRNLCNVMANEIFNGTKNRTRIANLMKYVSQYTNIKEAGSVTFVHGNNIEEAVKHIKALFDSEMNIIVNNKHFGTILDIIQYSNQ